MPELSIEAGDVLVVVDVQHDFLPGGALGVAEGERIFAPINALLPRFPRVYATRDWHPPDHSSFTQHGGPWPVHCVAGSHGAALDQRLRLSQTARIVDLRAHGVRRIFVCGLATDYCVKATALDAKAEGFGVVVLADASAAVNLRPTDEGSALEELRRAGVRIVNSTELLRQIAMLAAAGRAS
jgi:nicotinamidase/pyrazinamidase